MEELKEIEQNKNVKSALEQELISFQKKYAQELLNGEGKKIIENLNKPIKVSKTKVFILKIKKFFELLFNTI